jgi:hypothetical protein
VRVPELLALVVAAAVIRAAVLDAWVGPWTSGTLGGGHSIDLGGAVLCCALFATGCCCCCCCCWAVLRPPVDAAAAGTKGVAGETLSSADQAHRRPLN